MHEGYAGFMNSTDRLWVSSVKSVVGFKFLSLGLGLVFLLTQVQVKDNLNINPV